MKERFFKILNTFPIPPIYVDLFLEFFKIGLFAVGGGLATIPFIFTLIHKYHWIAINDLPNIIAISTITPGPIGVSIATYIGCHVAGVWGGVIAALGIVTPSVIVIIIIAKLFEHIAENPIVKNIFYGLRAAVTGLIGASGFVILKLAVFKGPVSDFDFNYKAIALFLISLLCLIKFKFHPVFYIVVAAILGVVFKF